MSNEGEVDRLFYSLPNPTEKERRATQRLFNLLACGKDEFTSGPRKNPCDMVAIQQAIRDGADFMARNLDGRTPLDAASILQNQAAAWYLLSIGAGATMPNSEGESLAEMLYDMLDAYQPEFQEKWDRYYGEGLRKASQILARHQAELPTDIPSEELYARLSCCGKLREVFSPQRWQNREQEALDWIHSEAMHPVLQAQLIPETKLLQAILETRQIQENSPLSRWTDSVSQAVEGRALR